MVLLFSFDIKVDIIDILTSMSYRFGHEYCKNSPLLFDPDPDPANFDNQIRNRPYFENRIRPYFKEPGSGYDLNIQIRFYEILMFNCANKHHIEMPCSIFTLKCRKVTPTSSITVRSPHLHQPAAPVIIVLFFESRLRKYFDDTSWIQ